MNLTETVFANLWFKHKLFTMWTSWTPCVSLKGFLSDLLFFCVIFGVSWSYCGTSWWRFEWSWRLSEVIFFDVSSLNMLLARTLCLKYRYNFWEYLFLLFQFLFSYLFLVPFLFLLVVHGTWEASFMSLLLSLTSPPPSFSTIPLQVWRTLPSVHPFIILSLISREDSSRLNRASEELVSGHVSIAVCCSSARRSAEAGYWQIVFFSSGGGTF